MGRGGNDERNRREGEGAWERRRENGAFGTGEAWLITYTSLDMKEEAMDGAGSRCKASYRYRPVHGDIARRSGIGDTTPSSYQPHHRVDRIMWAAEHDL